MRKLRLVILTAVVFAFNLKAQNIVHLCVGVTHNFGVPSTSGSIYDWKIDNTSVAAILSGNGTELITLDLIKPGMFKLIVEETDQNGCLGSDSILVEIHDNPIVDIASLGPTNFCNGDNVTLKLTTTATTYNWSDGSNNLVNTVSESGNYFVIASNEYSCNVTSDTIQVVVHENPNIDFTIDGFCVGVPTIFTNNSIIDSLGIMNYSWYLDNGEVLYHDSISYIFNETGEYSISFLAVSDDLCKDSLTKSFTIYESLGADFTHNPFTVSILNPQVNFINTSLNSTHILWDFGDATTSILENPIHIFKDPGVHEVWLTVEDENNCLDSVQKKIKVYYDYISYVPTAFTPNDDGDNDTFGPYGLRMEKYQSYQFIIYNQWGGKVFETNDIEIKWDGSDAPTDTYSWVLIIKDELGKLRKETGFINLIR